MFSETKFYGTVPAVLLLVAYLSSTVYLAAANDVTATASSNLKDFAAIQGIKCETKDDAEETIKNVDSQEDCWSLCASEKKCGMAQYNKDSKKCTWWEKYGCDRGGNGVLDTKIPSISIAGKVEKKGNEKGFFRVPPGGGGLAQGNGYSCKKTKQIGEPIKATSGSPGKKCFKTCKKNKKCVAIRHWNKWDDVDSTTYYFCTMYSKFDKCENIRSDQESLGDLYLRPNQD